MSGSPAPRSARAAPRARAWLGVAAGGLALLLASCDRPSAWPPASTAAPPPEIQRRAVLALLTGLQFGPDRAQHTYREIRAAEIAGSHYTPATDRWTVHYCVAFVSFASDALARRCDLSVELYRLDSGKWVGMARGAGTLYRWQVLEVTPEAAPKAGAEPSAGGAPSP